MSFSPQALLSAVARDRCIAKLKKLPTLVHSNTRPRSKAAVLIPLFVKDGEVHILYTLRSSALKSHSGQVSFPGGKMEEAESVFATALRETEEEIGLPRTAVDTWSEMPQVEGRDGLVLITPVVGVIKNLDFDKLQPNIHEVEEIFSVPVRAFCDKRNHAHLMFKNFMLPVFLYDKHKIWGITGMITHFFLQCFLPSELYKVDFSRKGYTLDELTPNSKL